MNTDTFISNLSESYHKDQNSIQFGKGMVNGVVVPEVSTNISLKSLSRHGLIAGATGTGKTKTMQKFAELLSKQGISSLLMDIKGDLSGISMPSSGHPKIDERQTELDIAWSPESIPTEFLTISDSDGVKVRATVSEFGPVLFSKILDLNDVQTGVVTLIFKYCDDAQMPLLNLADFKKVLQYLTNEGKEEIEKEYGAISPASTSAIMRSVVALEQQGGESIFGERSFDVQDLVRNDTDGKGLVSVIRLNDIQNKPKLFSTFMLCLLAEIYSEFPEEGDLDKPKLCIFIDEAHLVFDNASKNLLDQLETIIKLIRSKGVGIYFVTQNPVDIPSSILSQLGIKIQHALRAVTAKDNKAIKQAADNYPLTDFYDVPKTITSLGIGEAFITGLDKKGIPTPLIRCKISAPETRMDVISDSELSDTISKSRIASKYNTVIDSHSAYEMLTAKLDSAAQKDEEEQEAEEKEKTSTKKSKKKEKSFVEELSKNTMVRQLGRVAMREVTRGLLGVLGVKRR